MVCERNPGSARQSYRQYRTGNRRLSLRPFFFFFQAEDGIRDVAVTGVQTCALPICGTVIGAAAGVVMAALAWAGLASVATVIAPMFCYAFGLGWVLPNAMAGAIGPFPRMAGLAAAGAGFVQLTGSALYAIAVSHTYDGTLRPMTTAVATAGIAALVTFALLRRGRVVLDSTERRRP